MKSKVPLKSLFKKSAPKEAADEYEEVGSEEKEETSASAKKTGKLPWLISDPKALKQESKRAEQAYAQGRIPEVWFFEDKVTVIRVRHLGSAAMGVYRYSIPNGKRYDKYTAPAEGEFDMFAEDGLTPRLDYIYEVFDRTGYVDKKTGKTIKDKPKFLIAGSRIHKNLITIEEQCGPLCDYDISVKKSGSGQGVSYTMLPKFPKTPITPSMRAEKRLSADMEKWFAPPDEATQRRIFSRRPVQHED